MTRTGEPLIELRDATLGYQGRAVLVQVQLAVNAGEFLGLVGPNGSGKTTLLRAVLGVIQPLAGTCRVGARLGYVPQRAQLDPVFPLTAGEVVRMGLLAPHARELRAGGAARAREALSACGMLAQHDTPFRDLSGGQRQRVLVARALVSRPEVLVLDEPTNDLDLRGEHEMLEVVRGLHAGGRAVIMVSHQLGVVARFAETLGLIDGDRLEVGPAAELLTPERLGRLYGVPIEVGTLAGRPVVVPAASASPGTGSP